MKKYNLELTKQELTVLYSSLMSSELETSRVVKRLTKQIPKSYDCDEQYERMKRKGYLEQHEIDNAALMKKVLKKIQETNK
jgi:hypothetical protein